MARAHGSRVVRIVSRLLLPLAAAVLACGDGSDGSSAGTNSPVISGFYLWPEVLTVDEGGGMASVSHGVNVIDADADVANVVVTLLDASESAVNEWTIPVENPPGATTGTLTGSLPVPTTAVATYTVEVQVVDRGGRGSNVLRRSLSVVAGNGVPTITELSPESVTAGSAGFTLTVTGTDFVHGSTVYWNGFSLPTDYVDATTIQAQVDSYRLSYTGSAQVTVYNPAPGGGTSAAATFVVGPPAPNPVPTLTSISPASVDAGAPSVTLTVTGSGFVPSSLIRWNGQGYFSTTFVDSTTLQASVSSWEISTPRTATITVSNPTPGGGTSSPLTFTVARPEVLGLTLVSLKGNDLAWDPFQQRIYVSVPSVSPVNPNTVTVLDPFTGELTGSQFVGSEPDRLALSDDGRLLYVALHGATSVERLAIPGLLQDLSIGMGSDPVYGPYYASDISVAPGSPSTLAASLSTKGSWSVGGGTVIYDDATPRPTRAGGTGSPYNYGSLQWGTTASDLYASSTGYGYDLYTFSVDASGILLRDTYPNAFSSYGIGIHFDEGTSLLYAEDGRAVDPGTGQVKGTFPVSGYSRRMVPDSSLGSAFFVTGDTYTGLHATLDAYDVTRYYSTRSTTLPFVGAPQRRLIRWGVDGLAFLTPDAVVLFRGAFVLPVSETENPVPTLGSVSPSSAVAGSPNLVLTVTGTDFVRGSAVRWNGSERTTTFVSPTSLVAYCFGLVAS